MREQLIYLRSNYRYYRVLLPIFDRFIINVTARSAEHTFNRVNQLHLAHASITSDHAY